VASRWSEKLCYVVTPDGLEARPVETGQFNDSYIEIRAGLAEGEVISLVPPRFDDTEKEQEPPDEPPADDARERRGPADDEPPGPADDEADTPKATAPAASATPTLPAGAG